jgi:hypothetical protein
MNDLKLKLLDAKSKRESARWVYRALRCLVLKPPVKTCDQAVLFLSKHGASLLEDGLNGQRCFFLRVIADRDAFFAYRSRKACLAANVEVATREVYAIHREMNALANDSPPASDLE